MAAVGPNAQRFADAWAGGCGLPTRPSVEQHGGGETWAFHDRRLPSMLVEGVSRELTLDELRHHRRGFEAVLDVL